LLFARSRCDGGSEPRDASAALAGRRELERSGSRRPEKRSDGGLAPGGQRRRGTARAIRRGVERSGTEQPRAHAGRDAARPTGAKHREHRRFGVGKLLLLGLEGEGRALGVEGFAFTLSALVAPVSEESAGFLKRGLLTFLSW